jgi:DNA-binding MarR family transcriptional regulator
MRWYAIPVAEQDEESLAESFWAVARELRHLGKSSVADVTPAQARALVTLARRGTMRPGELSDHLRIAPRSTTEVVDALEAHGLVERRPDPNDRRATLVEMTEAGTQAVVAIRRARTAEAETFFGRLSETDRAHLQRILRKLRGDTTPRA